MSIMTSMKTEVGAEPQETIGTRRGMIGKNAHHDVADLESRPIPGPRL